MVLCVCFIYYKRSFFNVLYIYTVGVKSLSPVDIYPFLSFFQHCGSAKKLEIFFIWNQVK